MKTIQKTAIALAASGLFATAAFAQTAPAAEAPEVSPVTANVMITNDYRYRGISQKIINQRFKVDLTTLMRAASMLVTGTAQSTGLQILPTTELKLQSKWTSMVASRRS